MKRFNRFSTLHKLGGSGIMLALALTLCLGACAPTSPEEMTEPPPADLEATLDVPSTLSSGEAVNLTFTLTNNTDTRLYVLKWYTPLEGIAGKIFRVERDGQAVPYQGILATRVAPSAEAYVLLEPGASASVEVDLATAYDFSPAGEYTIALISPRISHVARSEADMAESLDDLGPVQIYANTVTVQIDGVADSSDRRMPSVEMVPVQEAWEHLRIQGLAPL